MHNVFISFSPGDDAAARTIASKLQLKGLRVFFDREGIVAGESWTNKTDNELKSADTVLALLSSRSRRNSWVQDEIQTALSSDKTIISVLLDNEATQNWLWPLLATKQTLKLDLSTSQSDVQLEQLAQEISNSYKPPDGPSSASPQMGGLTLFGISGYRVYLFGILVSFVIGVAASQLASWLSSK